jgi:hypothetical protein
LKFNNLINNKKQIDHFLEKIAGSQVFSKSPVNRELLKYLTHCSLKGDKPKEFQIASDVFGKKFDADKEVNVRVYIHNLRKKLTEYYLYDGQDDELVFELPKGQYGVNFKHSPVKSLKKKVYRFSPMLFVASLIVLLGLLLFHVLFPLNQVKIGFWNDFLSNGFPTRMVLGDHYFFRGDLPSGKTVTVRDNRINSDTDFDEYLKQHPELMEQMEKTSLTYINNQAPLGLFYLMQLFGSGDFELEMDYSSRTNVDDFRKRNLLFIGSFKTLQQLKNTVEKLGLVYQIEETLLEYQTLDSSLVFDNRSTPYLSYEHATVAHFAVPDGRRVLFFLCDQDIGNMALIKFFTDPTRMKAFSKKLDELNTTNFKAVFEVKGENRTDFDISMIRIDALPDNIAEIWP